MKPSPSLVSTVAVLGATALAGCGGERFEARWTVQDVQQRFRELGGVGLEPRRTLTDATTLSLPRDRTDADLIRRRFGGAEILVATSEEPLEQRRSSSLTGEPVVVDNVLVRPGYSEDPDGFARAVRIVRSLGRPADAVRLPPGETPCERVGIDPDGGDTRTGTCLAGQRTVTVVAPAGDLRLPGVTVSRASVRTTRSIGAARYGSSRRIRATGRFVVARVRVENTADEPLDRLSADLVINGRRYVEDRTNGWLLQERTSPIQPGGVAELTFLFDVPPVADDARTGGALQFSADPASGGVPARSSRVGRIRLG